MSRRHRGTFDPNQKLSFSSLKNLLRESKESMPFFIAASILILLYTILSVYAPTPLGELSETLALGMGNPESLDMDAISRLTILLAILYGATAIMHYVSAVLVTTGVQRYCMKLRNQIAAKINRIPLRYFDGHATGDIMSRITNDVDSVAQNFDSSITMLLGSVFLLIGSITMMFVTSPFMALVCFATIPLTIIMLAGNMKLAQPAFRKRQSQVGVVNGIVEEHYSGQQIISLFNAHDKKGAEFELENKNLGRYMFRAQIFGGMMMPMSNLLSYVSLILVILVGVLLLADNHRFGVSYGVNSSFLVYIILFYFHVNTSHL